MRLKQILKSSLTVVYYCAGIWVSAACLGYGLSLKQFYQVNQSSSGFVVKAKVEKRWSIGFGYFGDVCFLLDGLGWFCVKQSYIKGGANNPGNIYWQIPPGSTIVMKGAGSLVAELSVIDPPPSRALVEYSYAATQVYSDLRASTESKVFLLLGFLLLPTMLVLRERLYRDPVGRFKQLIKKRIA